MGWVGRCSGAMQAVFDAAATGDARATQQAQAVCRLCPLRPACLAVLADPYWPTGAGPTGVIGGQVVEPSRRQPVVATELAA